jgi:glycosyltransferase involved in cell wall biosynthesis
LAVVADVHLVTQIRNRAQILAQGWVEGKHFTAIDSERVAARLHKVGRFLRSVGLGWTVGTALSSLAYYYFEHLVWKKFGRAVEEGRFDIVHRLTPLTPTAPSLIAAKCEALGVPFVLGPLNGGLPWPPGFTATRFKEGELLSYVRSLYKLLPGYRSTLSSASAIITGSLATRNLLPQRFSDKFVYVVENGIDQDKFPEYERSSYSSPIRFAFVGRLVPYKGADMAIRALSTFLKGGLATLDVYGDGPERESLQTLVTDDAGRQSVRFHGWVEHSDLYTRLRDADVLIFPSVREFGGAVVLEAMRLGIVPVVVAYGGPGELVTADTGFTIPLGTKEEIINALTRIVGEIIDRPNRLGKLSAASRHRVREHFTWEAKAVKTMEIYRWVLRRRSSNPEGDATFATTLLR